MAGVLLKVTTAVMKQYDQANLMGWLFQLSLPEVRKSRQELKLGRNLEAGANMETIDECWLLACFPCLAQPAFL